MELSSHLSQLNSLRSNQERAEWLEGIVEWITRPRELETVKPGAALKFLFQSLNQNEEWRVGFFDCINQILSRSRCLELFALTGVPEESGFFSEVFNRSVGRFLPRMTHPEELSQLVPKLFDAANDVKWIAEINPEIWAQLDAGITDASRTRIREDLEDALVYLASQAAAFGLLREVQVRLPVTTRRLADTPFLTLPHAAENLTAALRSGAEAATITQLKETLFEKIAQCRKAIAEVRAHLDTTGVSLSLTYRLEKIDRSLDRMDSLTSMLVNEAKWYTPFSLVFALDLIETSIEKRTLRDLFGRNLQILAKKIVENTGNSGENLIAEDTPAWNSMFAKALGGGIVVAPMAILQKFIYAASLAPGITGLLSSFNFIGGFIAMELAGFKLATKQPSMTASTLAARLDQVKKDSNTLTNSEARIQEFVVLVRNITRSQAASFFGNVMAVIPICLAFDAVWRSIFGGHFLDPGEALSSVFSVDPFTTPTILYAAFTGVLLWIASLASGWMENWSVYRGIPAAIASDYRIRNRLGAERAERLSKAFLKRVAPFSGAIALGLLLGVVPQITKFMGIPFSTRHVTLMTGTVTMGWSGAPVDTITFEQSLRSGLGILLIGGLNFGVSFALALVTAFRARGVSLSQFAGLMRAIGRAFAARPLAFIFP